MEFVYNNLGIIGYVYENDAPYSKEKDRLRIQLDEIMKRLFNLKNKVPIIDFLNAAYGDDISYEAKITYGDKEIINFKENKKRLVSFFSDMYIAVEDVDRILEYEIEFQTQYESGMIIRMFRYGFERAVKILNIEDFKNKDTIELNVPKPYIVVIEKKVDVPDTLTLKLNFYNSGSFEYKCEVLKFYEKDIEDLVHNNMYLLLPLSIVKLRIEMDKLSHRKKLSYEEKKSIVQELKNITERVLLNLDVLYNKNKIDFQDYDEMATIMENITTYLEKKYDKFIGIEEEVAYMVKSFYDPKIEEKGRAEGIEKGKKQLLIKQLNKRFGELSEDVKQDIMSLSIEKINEIAEAIFDIESLEDLKKRI